MVFNKFVVISGRGAVSAPINFKKEEKLVYYGPKNSLKPQDRFTKKERYEHFLIKHYEDRPFAFLDRFERFIIKYKTPFYVNIYNLLSKNFLKKQKIIKNSKKQFKLDYINKNVYECLSVDNSIVECNVIEDVNISCSSCRFSPHKRFRRNTDLRKLLKLCRLPEQKALYIRNPLLLSKLREKINLLYIMRCKKSMRAPLIDKILYKKFENEQIRDFKLEPQMDKEQDAHGSNDCPVVEMNGNTLNESQREASVGQPAVKVPKNRKRFAKLAAAEQSPDYSNLTDRYFPHKTYTWKKGDARHSILADITLPLDFVTDHPNSPNCILFNSYGYWDGDMEVKIMLNSNRFMRGQLQMAWYYGQDYEANFDRRDNVFTASQQAHCLVSAAASNEGLLYIPFRYYKPKMGTKIRVDDPGRLNMGRLTVRVLNQLDVPSTTYGECTFTISIRFINSNFSGMLARDLGKLKLEPNMFGASVKAALSLLDEIGADPERDNPPDTRPANAMIPWSAHSWSLGDNVAEPINPMRLIGPGQTPHPAELVPQFDEMSINYVKSIYSLTNIVEWSTEQRTGTLLFTLPGAPLADLRSEYYSALYDGTECYALPAVGVLSSLFAYWRGSLDLRLDLIATFAHTGRLLIASVPRVMEAPTLEQAKSCPHAIFDLQGESRQVYFNVPYIADRPWWPTHSIGNNILPPTNIYCFVLNELVPMESVSKTVEINLYIRGGEDFEVSIPVVPRLGLSTYNAKVIIPIGSTVKTKQGYTPMYVGEWRYVYDGTACVLRYGNVTDHIVQFVNLKRGKVYVQDEAKNGDKILGLKGENSWYIVAVNVDVVNDMGLYAAYFSRFEDAKNFALGKSGPQKYIEDSDWFKYYKNGAQASGILYFKEEPIDSNNVVYTPNVSKLYPDLSYLLVANMDERTSVSASCEERMLPLVPGTQSGRFTFGEHFDNLKTLCRRYQLYHHATFDYNVSDSLTQGYRLPIMLQGLVRTDSQLASSTYYNSVREGPIPIIASAYRYGRGSFRGRIVWRSNWDCTLRLEIRADERFTGFSSAIPSGHRSYYNDGYAFMVQNTRVNNVLEFEVPFYQSGLLAFLQNPKIENNLESYHFSLGNMYMAFMCIDVPSRANKKVIFDIYYSIGDDCRFSVFQGFPMMMQVPDEIITLEPQMGLVSDVKALIDNRSNVHRIVEKVEHVVDKVDNILPGAVNQENKAAEGTQTEIPTPSVIEQEKEGFIEWITKTIPKQFRAVMVAGITQLVHCVINPTIKTICWSLASFLASIGILCSEMLAGFCKTLKKVIEWLQNGAQGIREKPASQTKQPPATRLVPDMGSGDSLPDDVKAGLVGTIVASIGAMLGASSRLPKTMPDFTRGVWDNLGKFSFTANHLTTFFKNNLAWIVRAYKWVLRKVFPKKAIAVELQDMGEEIVSFAQEATILLDEANARKCEVHPKWNLRVYQCAAHASILLHKMSGAPDGPRSPALLSVIRQMIKKRDDLTKCLLSPPVRFEPFVLAFSGESNIGKSHLCQEIGKKLLQKIDYKTYDELIYTRTPGNPYWNQLRNQPICLFDDFMAVGGEHSAQQAAELFCLKSRAVFNPPQAEIENKHIRYNPLLVFLATNSPFPKVPEVNTPVAFYRRRDFLIRVAKRPEFYTEKGLKYTDSPKKFKASDIRNFEHLKFYLAVDVTKEDTKYSEPLSYEELNIMLGEQFSTFYTREMELYMKAMKEAYDFFPDDELSNDSCKELLERMAKNLENVNSFRYGSIGELKSMIFSLLPTIDGDRHANTPSVISALRQLENFDKHTVQQILKQNRYVASMWNSYKMFGLEPQMEDQISIGNVVKNVSKTITTGCLHYNFNVEWEYRRDVPDKFTRGDSEIKDGIFYDPDVESLSLKESTCGDKCAWLDDKRFESDMNKWMNAPLCHVRKTWYEHRVYDNLPGYFIKKSMREDCKFLLNPTSKTREASRWERVQKEVKLWLKWSGEVIDTVGGKLWSVLKYASKIVVLLAGVFAIGGFAYHKVYPETKANKEAQYMVDNDIVYKVAFGGATGGLDAVHCVNAEVMTGNHWTQNAYPTSVKEEAQMVASGDYKTFGKQSAPVKDVAIKYVGQLAKEQETAIYRLIKRNTMFIQARYGTTELTGRILGLIGHYAITVDHYNDKFKKLPSNADVFILGKNFKIKVAYNDLCYTPFKNSSLGYYKLPLQVPPFKNLLKHMAYQRDHRHVGPNSTLVEPMVQGDEVIITQLYCRRIDNVTIEAINGFDSFVIPDGYKYPKGGRGMCGSVLVSDHLEHPIYGIHVAGDVGGKIGISEAVMREMFIHLERECAVMDAFEPHMFEDVKGFLQPQSDVMILGAPPNEFAHRETGVSKVIPTECSGELFPVYCAPPVLGPKDERIQSKPFSPMLEGCNKHGIVTSNFPIEFINLAFEDLKRLILAKVKPIRHCVGKLSKSVAVVGSPYYKGYEKLDFNTSEGFPYTALRPKGCKSKLWMLNLEQTETGEYLYHGCDDTLKTVMKLKKEQRLRRCLPFTVFVDCLKDRKLPKEKILKPGSVRIFSISPIDYTIQVRQLFMDFTVAYQEARLDVEHAIGIDVNSYEWSDLAHRLLKKGNKMITLDYSGFGPSLNALCAQKAIEIIRAWYQHNGDNNDENDLQREMMGYEIIHSVHLMFNILYRTMCGLPSGGPLTVVQNSLVNCLYLRVSWMLIFSQNLDYKSIELDKLQNIKQDSELYNKLNATLDSFHKHTECVVYGDDVIIAVSDDACELFNAETISDVLFKYGIIIKNASKSDEIVKYNSLLDSNTTFLKNNFLKHPKRQFYFLAALDKKSIEDTCNWTFKEWQHKLREISLEACDATIRSAFGHGPGYFDYVRDKIFSYWISKNENMTTPTWDEIDRRNYG